MRPHLDRELVAEPIDQRRSVLVQKVDEPDLALLRMSAREGLRLRVLE